MIQQRNLDDLNIDDVQQALAEVSARVQEDNPKIATQHGVFRSLVLYYHSVLSTRNKAGLDDYQNARSLKQITADPSLADVDLVDDVLSNFRVERKVGNKATGEITVVRDNNLTVTLTAGTSFVADGLNFVTTLVYTAKAESSQVNSDSDRLIVTLQDGTYAFTVPVEAESEGSEYLIAKDTVAVPDTEPRGYITSYATSNFTGGTDTETNQELIDRLQVGIAARAMSNRVNMMAMLREIDAFSRIVAMSIIGYGDQEMLRDRHWIWPVSGGGRVDWYIRSTALLERTGVTLEASLVEITDDFRGVWQISIDKDTAPGFLEIANIRQTDASTVSGGYEITSESRDVDLTGTGFRPDVLAIEGEYSAFQVVTVLFIDSDTDTTDMTVGDKRDYSVEIKSVPLIADIQERVSSRDIRNYGGDCLIKAPIPCFTQLSFKIFKQSGQSDPDVTGITKALCETINTLGFDGRIYASKLHDTVHNYLESGQSVGTIDMFGRLRYPGGEMNYIRSGEVLTVPDDPGQMVTSRTVQFFIEPGDIAVSIITRPTTDV